MNSVQTSRAQRELLDQERASGIRQERIFGQLATPEAAISVGQTSLRNPLNSSEYGLALATSGGPTDSPEADEMAAAELRNRPTLGPQDVAGGGIFDTLGRGLSEFVYDPVKGAARWGMMGLMAVYEETLGGAQLRTLTQMDREDMEYGEAHRQQGSFFVNGLRDAFRDPGKTWDSMWAESMATDEQQMASMQAQGADSPLAQTVNAGNGWFAQSSVAPEVQEAVGEATSAMYQRLESQNLSPNERYKAELLESPQIWSDAVANVGGNYQQGLGAPMTQQGYANRESVLYQIPSLTTPGVTRYTPWSPGRFAAATMFEPGTRSFSYASGVGDVASQIFLDPTNLLAAGWSKMGKASRTVRVSMGDVAGTIDNGTTPIAGMRASRVTPDVSSTSKSLIDPATTDPSLFYGGTVITDSDLAKVRDAVKDNPAYTEMVDEGIWFNNPDDYKEYKWMQKAIEDTGAKFEDIRQANLVDGMADPTAGALREANPIIRSDPYDPTDWMTPTVPGEVARAIDPRDPPEWFTNLTHFLRTTIDEPRAQMFAEDFARSGEDVYLADGVIDDLNSIDATNRIGQTRPFRSVKRTRGANENAMVRVYGNTLDLSGTTLPANVPAEVKTALKEVGAWSDVDGFTGFVDPTLNNLGPNLSGILAKHGYGKIDVGEDGLMILDDFVGGAKGDAVGRVFWDSGDAPLMNGVDEAADATNVTPNQIKQEIEDLVEAKQAGLDVNGNLDPEKLTPEAITELAGSLGEKTRRWREAYESGNVPGAPIPGARPTVEPGVPLLLTGRKSDKWVNDLWRIVEDGDATTSPARLDRALHRLDNQGITVPRGVREDLLGATSKGDVESTLTRWMAGEGPKQILLPGGTRYGRIRSVNDALLGSAAGNTARGQGVMTKFAEQNFLARRFAMMMPTKAINFIDDPDGAYRQLTAILPNYNVRRGATKGIKYRDMNGVEQTTRGIEEVLTDLRRADAVADPEGFFKSMSEYTEILFASNIEAGAPTALASRAAQWVDETGEFSMFFQDRLGKISLGGHLGEPMRINGAAVHQPGANAVYDVWKGSIAFPDSRMVKRIGSYNDRVGRISQFLTAKKMRLDDAGDWKKVARRQARKEMKARSKMLREADTYTLDNALDEVLRTATDVDLQDRAWFGATTTVMNKVWKPLVLLRGAWTLRILLDDQLRTAADGMSIFNHPTRIINYAMSLPASVKESVTKGFIDVNGVRIGMDTMDDLGHAYLYKKSMMAMPDPLLGKGAYGSRHSRKVARGAEGYQEGWSAKLNDMGADPITRHLAQNAGEENAIELTVEWLRNPGSRSTLFGPEDGVTTQKILKDLARSTADDPELIKAIESGSIEELTQLVRGRYADLHYTTGGRVAIDPGDGRWVDYEDRALDVTADFPNRDPRTGAGADDQWLPEVMAQGDEDLLDGIAKGVGLDSSGIPHRSAQLDEWEKMVGSKLAGSEAENFPGYAYAPIKSQTAEPGVLDKTVKRFFEYLMTGPSDRLSRSPLFARSYWRTMGESLPFMSDELADVARLNAKKAGYLDEMNVAAKRSGSWIRKDPDAGTVKGMISGEANETNALWDALDNQAKAAGLAQVERTLFDLSNKRNISDSLNLIFPFVEAWGEFATRWGRLMVFGDRNIKNMNRLQQGINGLRESNPFDPQSSEGFMYKNDFGDEVFAYPAFMTKAQIGIHNVMTKIPGMGRVLGGPIDSATADSIKATGSVEAMNFAAGVIPGFGPVFQLGVKTVLPEDDPTWDPIRNMVSPFGSSGGPVSQFAPAWIKRIVAAQGSSDTQLNATYMSTVQDVIKTMMNNGEFDAAQTLPDFNAKIKIAEERAKGLLMVRAAATWWNPAAPQYTLMKEDTTGQVYTYSQIGEAYRNILYDEAEGNPGGAWEIFNERYGYLPAGLTGQRSYAIEPRSLSDQGYKFQRENPELFDAYPGTAMFLEPRINGESDDFNYGQYIAQIRKGQREQYTAEQIVAINDDMLGNIEWGHFTRSIRDLDTTNPDEHDRLLVQKRADIQSRHPYWRVPTPGKKATIYTNKQQLSEVRSWLDNPAMRNHPVVEAARQYVLERDAQLARIELKSLDKSMKPKAIEARTILRELAAQISQGTPSFDTLWRQVFSREVSSTHDGFTEERVDFYGADLFEETMGIPPNVAAPLSNPYLQGGNV